MNESTSDYGLGRRHSPDINDTNYHMSTLLVDEPPFLRKHKYWYGYYHYLNQGNLPHCVGYSLTHYLLDAPITNKVGFAPSDLYFAAQHVDEWDGTNYSGTSVRAGAKILQEWGYISNYYWAWNTTTITSTLLTLGPVVVGTTWYSDMFTPDRLGRITPTGIREGGHAYIINGVNTMTGYYRIKNSWGTKWGIKGHAYIAIEDMQQLISDKGEALIAVESRPNV